MLRAGCTPWPGLCCRQRAFLVWPRICCKSPSHPAWGCLRNGVRAARTCPFPAAVLAPSVAAGIWEEH